MYDDKYQFITFTLFSGLLSGFGFEIVISKPDPISISGLVFRSKPDPLVKNRIGFSGFRVPFTVLPVYNDFFDDYNTSYKPWYNM